MTTECRLELKIVPSSSRDEVCGWLGDALKIKVAAPPEKGKANKAVLKLLAKQLGIAASDIEVQSGASSAHKTVLLRGMTEEALAAKLAAL